MNQIRLTKSVVEKATPPSPGPNGQSKQTFIRCKATPGFGLRITSNGVKSFIVEKRIDGVVRRHTLGRVGTIEVNDARTLAMQHLTLIASNENPLAIEKADAVKKITLLDVFEDYLITRNNLKPNTVKDYRRTIDGALADWKHTRLADITRDMVEKRHRELGQKSHARANNSMRVLRAMFNHAKGKYEDRHGHPIFTQNPVDRISFNKGWYRIEPRRTYIKNHQLPAWFHGTELLRQETSRDYMHLLLFTGLRRSEGSALTWVNVDFEDKTFTIPETKNGRPHTLPMSTYVYELLKRRWDDPYRPYSDYVFSSDSKVGCLIEPKTAVKNVGFYSGVPFSLHDLRRTFITLAESLDISAYALKRLLNHRDPNDVTSNYIITDVERLREPMQRVCDLIEKLSTAENVECTEPLMDRA
jgi:integrase